jgi:hypothetical protein
MEDNRLIEVSAGGTVYGRQFVSSSRMESILGGPCGGAKLVMLRDTLFVEGDHPAYDLGQRVLDREVARIQPMHLGVRQCLQIQHNVRGSRKESHPFEENCE